MNYLPSLISIGLLAALPAMAGTVVITSLPDEERPIAPLSLLNGVPLSEDAEIRVGAFPGLSADALLDLAASGGYGGVSAALVSFGEACSIGDGAAGDAGIFEISVRQEIPSEESPLVGEEISIVIKQGAEFMVARFPGVTFDADPETGLEPVKSLHLADSKLIVGNRYGASKLATAPASTSGSFGTWIAGFSGITDPALRGRDADADGDGRSNFLEYASGGDPSDPSDLAPCQITMDAEGSLWIRFSRAPGIGVADCVIEASASMATDWSKWDGAIEPDPEPPVSGSGNWMRSPVPVGEPSPAFFRLSAE